MGGRERADGGGGREPVEVLYWDGYKSSFPGLDLRVILSVRVEACETTQHNPALSNHILHSNHMEYWIHI